LYSCSILCSVASAKPDVDDHPFVEPELLLQLRFVVFPNLGLCRLLVEHASEQLDDDRLAASFGNSPIVWLRPMSKSADKPKKQQKQKPQKTLKERRSEKRAAKKLGSGSFLPADK
jgi:hypothetical protein